MLIEIEGIDGAGKTTQAKLLKSWLRENRKESIIVKDFESTKLGKIVKKFLLNGELKTREAELFFILACKSHLFARIIIPFMKNGGVVICDRGIGSFISYFESFGLDRKFLSGIVGLSTNGFIPDLTFLIDVSVEDAIERNVHRRDQRWFDKLGLSFFRKQREIFLELSQTQSWIMIDGTGSIEQTHQIITKSLSEALTQRELHM